MPNIDNNIIKLKLTLSSFNIISPKLFPIIIMIIVIGNIPNKLTIKNMFTLIVVNPEIKLIIKYGNNGTIRNANR